MLHGSWPREAMLVESFSGKKKKRQHGGRTAYLMRAQREGDVPESKERGTRCSESLIQVKILNILENSKLSFTYNFNVL